MQIIPLFMNLYLLQHCSTYTVMHPVEPLHTPRRPLTLNTTEQPSYSVSTKHVYTYTYIYIYTYTYKQAHIHANGFTSPHLYPPPPLLLPSHPLPTTHHSCQYHPAPARQQKLQVDHAHPSRPRRFRPTRAHKPCKIALYFL